MTHLHWMPLYIGDELARTSHLSAEEFGAYISLIMHYWQHGGLPDGDQRLARLARCSSDRWPIIREMVEPLFEPGWSLPKLESDRLEAEETHRKRSEAGKKGGRPRRDEKPGYKPGFSYEKAGHYAGPKQPQPHPHPHSHPSPKSEPDPQDSALEEGRTVDVEDTRETMFTPYPAPSSPVEGKEFLLSKGVQVERLDECLRLLLAGNLSPYDLEGILSDRSAA